MPADMTQIGLRVAAALVLLFVAVSFVWPWLDPRRETSRLRWAVAALLCAAAYYDVGRPYGGYAVAYGLGVATVHSSELVLYAWYGLFGTAAFVFLFLYLRGTDLPGRCAGWLSQLAARPRLLLGAGGAGLLVATLIVRHWVLHGAQIADDETTYVFIARTLLYGRLVNPSPGDVDFFANQFMIASEHAWYGKYPIGHPLLLMLGEAVGLRVLVVPLVSAGCLALTYVIGRRLLGAREATLASLLVLASPQFVFTAATQLSQPSAALFMLLGAYALLRWEEEQRAAWVWLAGAALGFGLLVRPLPGVLFAAAGLAYVGLRAAGTPAQGLRPFAQLALPVLAAVGVFALVNAAQTGDALRTGYHEAHGANFGVATFASKPGLFGSSLGAAVLRQSFWLTGFPLAVALLAFVGPPGRLALPCTLVVAGYAYRLIAPKTVVASTGPIYVMEVVPLLALLLARGSAGLARRLEQHGHAEGGREVAAMWLAAGVVTAAFFLPIQVANLSRSGQVWTAPYRLLEQAGAGRAVVFAETMVDHKQNQTWAYFPPNPKPDLSDEVLFLRRNIAWRRARRTGDEHVKEIAADAARAREYDLRAAYDLWQRRFRDRRAFVLEHHDGKPVLRELLPTAPASAQEGSDGG